MKYRLSPKWHYTTEPPEHTCPSGKRHSWVMDSVLNNSGTRKGDTSSEMDAIWICTKCRKRLFKKGGTMYHPVILVERITSSLA